ncbi:MAG: hypothetical protein NT080_05350 [Spirochaetes bacterium]|nr:hypothetical protein [Spirochaetota bacterium]
MLLLIKNADLRTPRHIGRRDILVAAGTILAVEEMIDPSAFPLPCEVLDAGGRAVVPGIVDGHVHVSGGGGEGGFHTRTPELRVSDALHAGVTTVVGVLGTDGVARSVEALVAKVGFLQRPCCDIHFVLVAFLQRPMYFPALNNLLLSKFPFWLIMLFCHRYHQ